MLTNITNYQNVGDWFYLVTAVFVVDLIVIFLEKYPGLGDSIDIWYNRFGLAAVGADVLSILIVIGVTRYFYTYMGFTNPLYFIVCLLFFQIIHDVLFYVGVIQPLPAGHNAMIDVFKSYAQENGAVILLADSMMMVGTVVIGSFLKSLPDHFTSMTALLTLYSVCYVLYTVKRS
jgi:hypothetical protein